MQKYKKMMKYRKISHSCLTNKNILPKNERRNTAMFLYQLIFTELMKVR